MDSNLNVYHHDEHSYSLADLGAPLEREPSQQPLIPDDQKLGKTAVRETFGITDFMALTVSLLAFTLAMATVQITALAWYLTYVNQIVVIGFLLSLMNLCLMAVLPTLFLRCEAYYGRSVIQNYEAIMRNRPTGSHVSWQWRGWLILFLALPLGLSAAYKKFTGGMATVPITLGSDLYNNTFGLFAPPGLLPLGYDAGTFLIYNITIPFFVASTNQTAPRDKSNARLLNSEDNVPLPDFPQPYGINTLLIGQSAAALLDMPPPEWITQVQSSLNPEADYLEVSATVLAVVASQNKSVEEHRDENENSDFWSVVGIKENGSIQYKATAPNSYWLGLLPNALSTVNQLDAQAFCFISFQDTKEIPDFIKNAQMFDISRQYCWGVWHVTRGSMALWDASCDPADPLIQSANTMAPTSLDASLILTQSGGALDLLDTYLPALMDFLAIYKNEVSNGTWAIPSMAMSIAAMYWSRLAVIVGPGSPHWEGNNSFAARLTSVGVPNRTSDGLLYQSQSQISFTRPSLALRPLLYVVLAVLPFITVVVVITNVQLRHIPIGRGFGIVAILAGIDKQTLSLFKGAGYSGELTKSAHVEVSSENRHGEALLAYRIIAQDPNRPAKMRAGRKYG